MSINTLSTHDLELERRELESTLESLISDIPDSGDEGYVEAAEALADWLGLAEHDHIEFIGGRVWLNGPDECLRFAVDGSEGQMLKELEDLSSEIYEWQGGVTLIDEDDFEEYAQEYANDIGCRDLNTWPHEHIDWAAASEALAKDYQSVTFRDSTYLYRS